MDPTVSVKFRKNKDYSNENKNSIIFELPPVYRVNQSQLNDMDNGGTHSFIFKNEESAGGFAKNLFNKHNQMLDISTNFTITNR